MPLSFNLFPAVAIFLCMSTCTLLYGQEAEIATRTMGIAATEPAEGPFVKVDQGFMVPYQQSIPGTELKFKMIPVAGGEYLLGSPPDEVGRKDDEGPQIQVVVDPMWVAETEVTWAQYKKYMELHYVFQNFAAQGIRKTNAATEIDAVTAPTPLYEPSFTFEYGEEPDQPAVTMTQYAAKQFTKWISGISGAQQYRLPTEAEWEYAARAQTTSAYYWGDSIEDAEQYASFAANAKSVPEKVGLKEANAFGLRDMLGSVAEWTVNQHAPTGYSAYVNDQPINATEMVKWPKVQEAYVIRGGSWESDALGLRCASKLFSNEEDWKEDDPNYPRSPWWYTNDPTRGIGFRLFRSYRTLAPEVIEKFWNATAEEVNEIVEEKVADGRSYFGKVDADLPEAIEKLSTP